MSKKILHIAGCDKFIPPFIELVKENFDFTQHEFLIAHGMAEKELKITPNVHLAQRSKPSRLKHYWRAIIKMHQADKVILHGLFDPKIVMLLFFMPWLLKKCYWVMWGGDLYAYSLGKRTLGWYKREFFRRPVIKNMGHLVAHTRGEYDLAKAWYDTTGKHHKCFVYPSNLYYKNDSKKGVSSSVNILVGNSADSSNNHSEVFEILEGFKFQKIKIIVPLSYGDRSYAEKIIKEGKARFGNKFYPLTDFISFEKYLKLLSEVDIAIFNHNRQQAMGTIRTLLGLGKKVYLRRNLTSTASLLEMGVKLFFLDKFDLDTSFYESNSNSKIIEESFSEIKLIHGLKDIFEGEE